MNLNTYKKRRLLWLNSSFNNGFNLNDNKIYELFFDLSPFQLYKNTKMKVVSYTRDDNQSKPIVVKLKDVNFQRSSVINTDNEGFPIIYFNHTGVEGITYNYKPTIILTPQQIPRITLRLDDDYNNFNNGLFGTITNGEILRTNNYDPYIIFKSSGSFVLNKNLVCDILVVGGGGGGSTGGGGAGQVVYKTSQLLIPGNYSITVGLGGNGLAPNSVIGGRANDGNDSVIQLGAIDIIRAYKGGGAPGNTLLATAPNPPYGSTAGNGINSGGSQNTFPEGNVLGFVGGISGFTSSYNSGGGGGGAGEKGENGTSGPNATLGSGAIAGRGGNGIQVNIIGINNYYGGGGGGGTNINNTTGNTILNRPSGGLGGGGQGSRLANEAGLNAEANSGGGGGGSDWEALSAGNGGSGIVIIKFSYKRIEGITPSTSLIQTTNANIPVTVNSEYQINYQPTIDLPKGNYSATFSDGGITFNSFTDRSYPLLKDANGLNINPLSWYKFDGTGSALERDEMGNYNLTNANNSTYDTTRLTKGNGSLLVSRASSQFMTFSGYNFTGKSFSICFWSYLLSYGSAETPLFCKGDNTNTPFKVLIIQYANGASGSLYFAFFADDWLVGNYPNDTNKWIHWTFTFNNSSKVQQVYRNGVFVANRTANASSYSPDSHIYRIGGLWINGGIAYFDGNFDDFRIYDFVLSASQVSELYNGRLAIHNPPPFILGLQLEDE